MKKIIISENNSGLRLDKFLVREFFSLGMTRGKIIRAIKAGEVLVNGKVKKPGYLLKEGDITEANMKKTRFKSSLKSSPAPEIKIIYEDENIIAVDKPAGIQVHPDHNEKKNTLVNWLVYRFPEIKNVRDSSVGAELRPGIVHRLDKDTSGVMVVARNMKSFGELKNLFKEHKAEKKYLALAQGILKNKRGIIDSPIARAGNYKKQTIAGRKTRTKIREAVTRYKVLKEFDGYSLLEVIPKTGRMHQIRVHLFSIGHPVVGDKLYKLKQKLQPFSDSSLSLEVPRQMLHAESIEFELFGKNYSFSSPLPDDFLKTQKSLG